ncbi:MAG: prenyltransferase/squalene oxidase repeat-containing protein [Syntrophothermus sp.]
MSWQLVSFLILGGVLLGGFAWYERSRPPSQVVALVAALAALAIAGRIAFAAFPNVKPTTDIVIFAGYALGGAPGFAVGSLAALVSNFWFGQGPWTPWQMAAWGLCGLLGAAVGLGWRNVGRFGLAAVCGLAAVLYGALLNFSLMATYGGELSWQRFLLFEGRAVPFEIAHAAGNVAFALLAGPAMLRMLVRFRERFEWSRDGHASARPRRRLGPGLRGGVAALALAAVGLCCVGAVRASAGEVGRAAAWLASVQNRDGGWGASPGDTSSPETTCWAMLGLEAAGRNPLDVIRDGRSPVDFLRARVAALRSPGEVARTILALRGAGVDPRRFGGGNLVSRLLAKRRPDGSYEGWPTSTAFAVMALRASGAGGGVEKTMAWLRAAQGSDGGWGDAPGSPSTADTTGAVLQTLARGSTASKRGLAYLRDAQRRGGGFALGSGGEVNAQSTAWATQGIIAAGADPGSFRKGGVSAPGYLSARQAGDGHYRYSASSDQTPVWVTAEAMVAAAGRYFPLPPTPRASGTPGTEGISSGEGGSSASGSTKDASTAFPGGAGPPVAASGGSSGAAAGAGAAVAPGRPLGAAGPSPAGSGGAAAGAAPGPVSAGAAEGPEAPGAAGEGEARGGSAADGGSGGGTLGAVVAGLVAGCLLFGVAWAARKGWMRWRYGI